MLLRIARVFAIVGLGVGLGLAWNALSGRGFALTSNVFLKPGDEELPVAEAKARMEKGARHPDRFKHLPRSAEPH